MIFASKTDQVLFDKLTEELADLYVTAETTNNKIQWRADRLNALIRRTRCKLYAGCRRDKGHPGCHAT